MDFDSAWYIELRGSTDHDAWVPTDTLDGLAEQLADWRLERVADRRLLRHAAGSVELVCAAADRHGNYSFEQPPQRANLITLICWGTRHEAACRALARWLADALRWEVVPGADEAPLGGP